MCAAWPGVEWFFGSDAYVVNGPNLKKAVASFEGAVGNLALPSGERHEFQCNIKKRGDQYIVLGVADATSEAELENGTAACGVGVQKSGLATVFTWANSLVVDEMTCGDFVQSPHKGHVSVINVRIQGKRLYMSFNKEPYVDLGFDLPEKVAPCMWMHIDDEIELHVERRVPLQLHAHMEEGLVTVVCINLAGETLERIEGLDPKEISSEVAQRIDEQIPAAPGTRWAIVLPHYQQCLDASQFLLPLRDLFELDQNEAKESQEDRNGS